MYFYFHFLLIFILNIGKHYFLKFVAISSEVADSFNEVRRPLEILKVEEGLHEPCKRSWQKSKLGYNTR